MLRRIKDEVECKLPPRLETRINCPLSEMQTFWYRRLLLKESSLLAEMEGINVMPGRKGRKPKGFIDGGEGVLVVGAGASAPPSTVPSPGGAAAAATPGEGGEEDGEEGEDEAGAGGAGGGGAAAAGGREGGSSKSYQRVMNLLMQLRKCCNHPFMFPDSEPDYDGQSTGEEVVEGSGKMKVGSGCGRWVGTEWWGTCWVVGRRTLV